MWVAAEGNEAAAAGPPAAKRAKLSLPATSTTEEDRKTGGGCRWKGFVGGNAAHLGQCAWVPIKCTNKSCTQSPLRRDRLEHEATCEYRVVPCCHCKRQLQFRALEEHEGSCPLAMIACANEGCDVQCKRASMNLHRAKCKHESVTCECPGCGETFLRKGMDAHVEATHMQAAGKQLQRLWHEVAILNAASESVVARLTETSEREIAKVESKAESKVAALQATEESEQHHAAVVPSSWVFNWRADGWEQGEFYSETHNFDFEGIAAKCGLFKAHSKPSALSPKTSALKPET